MKKYFLLSLLLCAPHGFASPKDAAKLVAINDVSPNIKIECMYATYNNFTGQRIYPAAFFGRCYLLAHVAEQLHNVQKELESMGYGLRIFDAFRPMEGQRALWNVFPVPGFVANPAMGGKHTRGTTVDLTIIRLSDGEPLDMGCGIDVFIDRARSDYTNLSDEALRNRALLKNIMAKHGFTQLPTEWWHFDYEQWQNYPPLDVDFNELA